MILFLVMITFIIVVLCLLIIDDAHSDIHGDSRRDSYYQQCHRSKN